MHEVTLWLAEQAGREPCGIRRRNARRRYLCSAPPEKSMPLQGCGHGEISVGFNQSVSASAPSSVFLQQRVCTSWPAIAQSLLSNRRRRRLFVPFWSFSCAARLELQLTLVLSDLMLIYFCALTPPGASAPPKTEGWWFILVHSAHFECTVRDSYYIAFTSGPISKKHVNADQLSCVSRVWNPQVFEQDTEPWVAPNQQPPLVSECVSEWVNEGPLWSTLGGRTVHLPGSVHDILFMKFVKINLSLFCIYLLLQLSFFV